MLKVERASMATTLKKSRRPAAVDVSTAPSLAQEAYERIEELIVTHKLPPGTPISEAVLSEHLGMSRTPVGEALQRLSQVGLVTILPRRGIIVTDVSAKQQLHLLELRRELDRFIAQRAARRATNEERTRFREAGLAFAQAAKDGDEAAFMRADKVFHTLFGSAARNEFALNAVELMDGLARRFWFAHRRQIGDLPLSGKLHANIAKAIADGDEAAAAQASDKLMDYLEEFTRATLHTDI